MNAGRTSSLPRVTISVVNWNGRDDTLSCLASLSQLEYENVQIIVVDNGSVDGSVAAIRSRFPEVRLIVNATNTRYARANNQAIELALEMGSDYVLLLNNDTLVAPDFLTHLVNRAESDDAIGMVGPKIYYLEQPQRLWYAGGRVSLWRGRIWHEGLRQIDMGQFDTARDVDYITGCCLLARRTCIDKIGLLDESFYIYGEDVDWCFRARRAGFRLVFEPRARVWHRISASSGGGLTAFKVANKIRGMVRFFRRYARWYHWLTIPAGMSLEALQAAARMFRDRNWPALRALVGAAWPGHRP